MDAFSGTVIAFVATLLAIWLLGPYGALLLLLVLTGYIISTHSKTKRIENDLRLIKEKLGITGDDKEERLATDEEIEEELLRAREEDGMTGSGIPRDEPKDDPQNDPQDDHRVDDRDDAEEERKPEPSDDRERDR